MIIEVIKDYPVAGLLIGPGSRITCREKVAAILIRRGFAKDVNAVDDRPDNRTRKRTGNANRSKSKAKANG